MFQRFCFNRTITDLSFIYVSKFRAIEHTLTRMRACEQLQKFCEHEQASTRVIFANNSSKGQILRALLNRIGPFDTPNNAILSIHGPFSQPLNTTI